MSSKREGHFKIRSSATSMGLDISASRAVIDETQLWEAENAIISQNGVINRAPVFTQIGIPIMEEGVRSATAGSLEHYELPCTNKWVLDEWSGSGVTGSRRDEVITLSAWDNGTGTIRYVRPIGPTEALSTSSSNRTVLSCSVHVRQTPATGEFCVLKFGMRSAKMYSVGFNTAGVSYIDATSGLGVSFAGTTSLVDGKAHAVTFVVNESTNVISLYLDGAFIGVALNPRVDASTGNFVEVSATSSATLDATLNSIIDIASVSISDYATVPAAVSIRDIYTDMRAMPDMVDNYYTGFAAGEKYVWRDPGLKGMWAKYYKKTYANTSFSEFRGRMVMAEYELGTNKTKLSRLGDEGFEVLDRAPNAQHTTEHASRLWAIGDVDNPLRVYYSGDRDPTTWVVPTDPDYIPTEADLLNAGFIDIPGGSKERLTHVYGSFFDMLIVCTNENVWSISGTSPADFRRSKITGEIGTAGPHTGAAVLNDYMLLGEQGVSSLTSTDKFGDVEGNKISHALRRVFDNSESTLRSTSTSGLQASSLSYNSQAGLLIMSLASAGIKYTDSMYAMSTTTGKWTGPFAVNATCIREVKNIGTHSDVTAIGTPDGFVKFWNPAAADPLPVDMNLASAVISGRSLSEELGMLKKGWGKLRIKVAPTGDWDLRIKWRGDEGLWKTATKSLIGPSHEYIGTGLGASDGDGTALVGTSLSESDSQFMIIEVPLDLRSITCKFEIATSAPRVSILGWEIDFTVDGYEKEA